LYQSLKKHEIVLESALKGMVKAIGMLKGVKVDEVNIDFDDSIIQDKESERQTDIRDVSIGALGLDEYRAKWYNETIEEARSKLPQVAEIIP